ncbi:MAG: glycosyltransferase family 4 protein [Thermoanaerobaculales bacterium]
MRVGSVVFANRYTGAGAVAEHFCRALRAVRVDAHLLFVGGDNLEHRLEGHDWASPALVKERNPRRIADNLRAIRTLADDSDIVVCHLPHDHLLCVAAGVHRQTPLVRAFRSPKHLRRDSYHRFLARRLSGVLPAFSSLARDLRRAYGALPTLALPVPLEDRFVPVSAADWRRRLEIPAAAPVLGMVGKLARGRAFDLLLEAAARTVPPAHVLVVGHGPAQIELETLATRLGIGASVRWVGYQEKALPALYAAMDVVLFAGPGSDWGHRSISEAQGCRRPVVAAAMLGVEDLIEDGRTGRIVAADPAMLARAVSVLLTDPEARRRLGSAGATVAEDRRLVPSGRRLAAFLASIAALGTRGRQDL